METILSSHIHELDKDTAGIVILLASSEMTRTKVRAFGHVGWGGQLLRPPSHSTWNRAGV